MKSLKYFAALSVLALVPQTQGQVFATASGPGGLDDATSTIGSRFEVTHLAGISVTHLGAFDSDQNGLTGSITVSIWAQGNATPLASATVNNASDLVSGYRYTPIAAITLAPGTYYVGATGFADPDLFAWTEIGDDPPTYTGTYVTQTEDRFNNASNTSLQQLFGGFAAGGSLAAASFQFTPVPEPETYAMIAGLGLVGFGLWRRRQVK